MRVLVAGATGAIGRPLVPLLVADGHEVTGMTRSPQKADALRAAGAEPLVCDALDPAAVELAMRQAQPEVVVHELTAIPQRLNTRRFAQQFEQTNRLREEGTRHLVAAARAAGARRVIAQSIAFAYAPGPGPHREEDPLSVNAPEPFRRTSEALATMERTVREAEGLEGTILRYGFFYGPGTAIARDGSIAHAVRRRQFPIGGDGRGVWSFIHVQDAARATAVAVGAPATGTFNIVDDEPAPVSDWLPELARAIGAPKPWRVPLWLVRLIGGSYAAQAMTSGEGASNARARSELGWTPQPVSWREGFRTALG